MKIHQIKIDFNVTDKINRYVFVYIVEGEYCYLIDSGVAGSEMLIEQYLHSIDRRVENIDLEFSERPIPNFYRLAGKSAKVNKTVKDGDIVTLEKDIEVQVVGTPGHSVDEIAFVIGENAFIGDCIAVKGDIPIYVDKVQTLNSMKKILQLANITNFFQLGIQRIIKMK